MSLWPPTRMTVETRPRDLPRREMPALTSIRALLAWWVVAYHFLPSAPFLFNPDAALLSKGRLAVDCFFVLSGFVLCHVHPVIIGSARKHAVADFLVSRLARIYPLHLVMLAAFALVVIRFGLTHGSGQGEFASYTWRALLRQVLLLHGWYGDVQGAWNVPSWSISSEWGAYLLAPLIFFCLARAGRASLVVSLALLGAITVYLMETGLMYRHGMGLPRVLLEFCAGAVLRTLLPYWIETLRRYRNPGLAAGWLVAAAAAFSSHFGVMLVAMVWLMVMLALRTHRAEGWPGRIERITLYLGETSYAVYMCHAFVLMLWGSRGHGTLPAGHPVIAALVLIVVVQGLASLLHHLVELPAQSRIRDGFRRRQSPQPARLHA